MLQTSIKPSTFAVTAAAFIVALTVTTLTVDAFNLDSNHALVQRGSSDSAFGFSVSLYRDRNVSWLLVGAPQAYTDQPGVDRGGAVYRCSIDSVNSCQQIPFDRTGPSVFQLGNKRVQEDDKSNQWFGATLHSAAEGPIVACAPRFVYFSPNLQRREPIGTCWISRGSFTGFYQYSPCKNANTWGFHRQGSCQAGMSAAVTKDGKRLFVGGPGSFYWQGQTFAHDLESQTTLETGKSGREDDDTFAGYSMTVGQFSSDREYDVAVGQPKGNNYTGRVIIFSSTLGHVANITGELPGSYFGYSLATADVNGDGLDDIIIGAPFYASPDEKDLSFEKGRVYFALQNYQHQFPIKGHVSGTRSKSRFGLSITSLGDTNKDGYDDIAVGAPYDGRPNVMDGNGAIYIYLGSKYGLRQEYSQVMYAEDVTNAIGLRTFGWSLSGGMDVDGNEYNDLLVGAYESNRAVLLRARPVVNVTADLSFSKESINLEGMKDCALSDGTPSICSIVKYCLHYDGIGVANKLDFRYRILLDGSASSPRMFFLHKEKENDEELGVTLTRGQKWCKDKQVYVMSSVRDKLSLINITMNYWLGSNSDHNVADQFGEISQLSPVINVADKSPRVTKMISIRKNCGQDNICKPDLQLRSKLNVDEYVIGSRKKLEMSVTVENRAEDAYETAFFMRMPYDVHYVNIRKDPRNPEVVCNGAKPDRTGANDLVCDLGNPLKANRRVSFVVIMEPAQAHSASSPDYTFLMNVTSTNPEDNSTLSNNQAQIGIPLRVEVELDIFGISEPEVISYNRSTLDEPRQPHTLEEIGKEIVHSYTLQNRGPTTITAGEVSILWPTRDLEGKFLLYLVDQVRIRSRENKATCRTITLDDLNPLGLKSRNSGRTARATRNRQYSRYSTAVLEDEVDNEEYQALAKNCGATNCTRIVCFISDLKTNETITFDIRSRFWKENIGLIEEFQISSKLVAMVTRLPYDVSKSLLKPEVQTIATRVYISGMGRGEAIPWWLILAAVLVGLLILGLLAFALWKLGFFKRKRPPKARSSDREPLRNSSY